MQLAVQYKEKNSKNAFYVHLYMILYMILK